MGKFMNLLSKGKSYLQELIPNWSSLRSIGNTRSIKLIAFTPLFGYLIIFNLHVDDYIKIHPTLAVIFEKSSESQSSEPGKKDRAPPENLMYVYIGLIFLSIGQSLFFCFCPKEVESFASVNDYIEFMIAKLTKYELIEVKSEIYKFYGMSLNEKWIPPADDQELTEKNDVMQKIEALEIFWNNKATLGVSSLEEREKTSWHQMNIIFKKYYYIKDKSYLSFRLISSLMYGIGFICLAVPSAKLFAKICFLLFGENF